MYLALPSFFVSEKLNYILVAQPYSHLEVAPEFLHYLGGQNFELDPLANGG